MCIKVCKNSLWLLNYSLTWHVGTCPCWFTLKYCSAYNSVTPYLCSGRISSTLFFCMNKTVVQEGKNHDSPKICWVARTHWCWMLIGKAIMSGANQHKDYCHRSFWWWSQKWCVTTHRHGTLLHMGLHTVSIGSDFSVHGIQQLLDTYLAVLKMQQ